MTSKTETGWTPPDRIWVFDTEVRLEVFGVRVKDGTPYLLSTPGREAAMELYEAAFHLRECQKAYMADRGNEEKGQAVGRAAEKLDAALAKARGET